MISCAAAKLMRCVNPSIAMTSPSWTCAAMASRILRSLVTQEVGDGRERDVDVLLVDQERRRKPQRALSGAEEKDALLEGAEHHAFDERGIGELHADHEAAAADVGDGLGLRREIARLA